MNNSPNSLSIVRTTSPRLPIKPALVSVGRRGGGAGEPPPHAVPPPSETVLLDCREVSRRLGIGRTKTFQLMARGVLPTVHLGRCVRVPSKALEEWIGSQTSPPSREL